MSDAGGVGRAGGAEGADGHPADADALDDLDVAPDEPWVIVPAREVVRRDPSRARALRPERELAERTPVGDAYLATLIRVQRTLALRLLAVIVVVIAGVPALFLLEPRLRTLRLAGIPIGWLIVGGAFYPMFVMLAFAYVRRTERNEAEFVELVTGRSDPEQRSGRRIERSSR